MSTLTSGMCLRDRFTLRQRIGAGGMSEVWQAEDEVLVRPVALKVIGAALAADPLLRAAMWTEARAAARLTHPHVAQVYDYGEASLPNGTEVAYLVMELVDGESLADRLRLGPLPWRQAAEMCVQIAAALAAAHRIGVVHRDVKPGNVMLARTGAKVLDFGIAALAGGQPNDGGRLLGTPAYAAPERLRPGSASPESDVYGLGVLLYESVVGHPPVAVASWPEAAAAHQKGMPVSPPDIPGLPRRVSRLCMACLSRDPAERPTAEDLAQGLAAAIGQPSPVTAGVLGLPGQPRPGAPSPRAGAIVGSAPIPHPPTMIESANPMWTVEPERLPHRRGLSPMMIWLIAAAVALGLTVAVMTAMLPSRTPMGAGQPAQGATPTSPPSSLTPSTEGLSASPTTQDALSEFDAIITAAVDAGRVDADAGAQLGDRVNELRGSLGKGKARKIAQGLQQEINNFVDDGSVDQPTADQLTALLQPLI